MGNLLRPGPTRVNCCMRKITVLMTILVMLAGMASVSGADAQTIRSPYRFIDKKKDLGLFVGYVFTDRGQAGLGPYANPLAGAKFTLYLSGPINLGAYVAYFPSERDIIDPQAAPADRVLGKTGLNLLLLAAQLKLQLTGGRTWHRLAPYFYGGVGAAFDVTSETSCIDDPFQTNCRLPARDRFSFGTQFMGQFGFGTIWLPTKRIGLRLTIDDTIWRLTTPVGFYDEGTQMVPLPPAKEWTNNIQLTIGAYYWF